MDEAALGFWARLWLAIVVPWKILFDAVAAQRIRRLLAGEAALLEIRPPVDRPESPAILPEAAPALPPAPVPHDPSTALQMLAILQREGRFVDFLQEDVSGF